MSKLVLRKPTYEEMEELVALCVKRKYNNPDNEDWEDEHLNVRSASICVFDNYISDCPGYAGRVMVVVWGLPEFTETFIWSRAEDDDNIKLRKVEVE